MAASAQVTPFSRWERELPKLVTDDRWRAVASMKQRRQLFDAFCKAAAEGHKRGRPARGRSAREGFGALLDEAAAPHPPAPGAAPLRPLPVRLLRSAPAAQSRSGQGGCATMWGCVRALGHAPGLHAARGP